MGKASKSGFFATLREGFDAIKVLDNSNVYAVLFSETAQNIFMSSMWQKVLNPYTLVVSGGDKMVVGNNITLAGLTRALVGVVAGRGLIDRLGADSTFAYAGLLGAIGICVNIWCLMNVSLNSIYYLNIVWAMFCGLWNSCLETEWARSVMKEKREDANGARQVLNKLTTAIGPCFSIALFLWVGGSTWTIPTMTFVMYMGTFLTIIPVILCFTFSRFSEVRQETSLLEVKEIQFANGFKLDCRTLDEDDDDFVASKVNRLTLDDFDAKVPGEVRLTYPLNNQSKFSKLRILTPQLQETPFILGKQVMASIKGVGNADIREPCILSFVDPSRSSCVAKLDDFVVYLRSDRSVSTDASWISFQLALHADTEKKCQKEYLVGRACRTLMKSFKRQKTLGAEDLSEALLPPSLSGSLAVDTQAQPGAIVKTKVAISDGASPPRAKQTAGENDEQKMAASGLDPACFAQTQFLKSELRSIIEETAEEQNHKFEQRFAKLERKQKTKSTGSGVTDIVVKERPKNKINLTMANVIVVCDVLNAIGSGMSLKFMDLFLIEDYHVSPVMLLLIAIIQNLAVVYLTPTIKRLMNYMRSKQMKGAMGVSLVWFMSMFFLALICVPGQNFIVSVVSIILMNSLSSCTKAYNRKKLVDALPHDRVANYMVWDSLNKANQGGIAVFGGQICHYWGYRGCFAVTLGILVIRWCVWTGYLVSRGLWKKKKQAPDDHAWHASSTAMFDDVGVFQSENQSELFRAKSNLQQDLRHTIPRAEGELMVVDEDEFFSEAGEMSEEVMGEMRSEDVKGFQIGSGEPLKRAGSDAIV